MRPAKVKKRLSYHMPTSPGFLYFEILKKIGFSGKRTNIDHFNSGKKKGSYKKDLFLLTIQNYFRESGLVH